jgi:L-erythro-3,5-diaminohexanoate dehydrogenase
MKTAGSALDIREHLGADRVLAPAGSLPQPAKMLDASAPVRPHELELEIERLCLDSTSFRQIRSAAGGDPARIAKRIAAIVAGRGKMHNPETDSGGIALGRVSAVGEAFPDPPAIGEQVVTLASLTLTPLRLETVADADPDSAQVEVRGHAYVSPSAPWARLPADLPAALALELLDVYGAGSHTRDLAPRPGTVCVLGAGHAGKLACAAARDAMGESGTVVAVDVDAAAVERLAHHGLCDIAVTADLRRPLAALEALREAGAPPAELTVMVVNSSGCEPAAILATAPRGTVLFFSMATDFSTAALTADGVGSEARLLIGSGYTPDVGAYALELLRRDPALRAALEEAREVAG